MGERWSREGGGGYSMESLKLRAIVYMPYALISPPPNATQYLPHPTYIHTHHPAHIAVR